MGERTVAAEMRVSMKLPMQKTYKMRRTLSDGKCKLLLRGSRLCRQPRSSCEGEDIVVPRACLDVRTAGTARTAGGGC